METQRTLSAIQGRFPAPVIELACRRQGLEPESQLVERSQRSFLPPKSAGRSAAARQVIAEVNYQTYNDTKEELLATLEEECLMIQPAVHRPSPTSSPKARVGAAPEDAGGADVDLDMSLRPHQSVGDANLVGHNDRFSRMAAGTVPGALIVGRRNLDAEEE